MIDMMNNTTREMRNMIEKATGYIVVDTTSFARACAKLEATIGLPTEEAVLKCVTDLRERYENPEYDGEPLNFGVLVSYICNALVWGPYNSILANANDCEADIAREVLHTWSSYYGGGIDGGMKLCRIVSKGIA